MQLPTIDGAEVGAPTYFRSKRLFYHASLDSGEAGWCFTVRGGRVYGPFETAETAEQVLAGMIEQFKRSGDTGGR